MRTLPEAATPNEQALAQEYHERVTGSTASSITLTYQPAQTQDGVSLVRLFKNGALLDDQGGASAYTISGQVITLGTALIVGDIVHVFYPYRV